MIGSINVEIDSGSRTVIYCSFRKMPLDTIITIVSGLLFYLWKSVLHLIIDIQIVFNSQLEIETYKFSFNYIYIIYDGFTFNKSPVRATESAASNLMRRKSVKNITQALGDASISISYFSWQSTMVFPSFSSIAQAFFKVLCKTRRLLSWNSVRMSGLSGF